MRTIPYVYVPTGISRGSIIQTIIGLHSSDIISDVALADKTVEVGKVPTYYLGRYLSANNILTQESLIFKVLTKILSSQ